MAAQAPHAVRMFNAFAREVVLTTKKVGSPEQKTALKKQFKLFDSSSSKYICAFQKRRLKNEHAVFDSMSEESILKSIPIAEDQVNMKGYIAGMRLTSSLYEDGASDDLVASLATAILDGNKAGLETIIIDEDLLSLAGALCDLKLSAKVVQDLNQIALRKGSAARSDAMGASSGGIVGLAEEISRELDIGSLLAGTGGQSEAGLSSIIESINQKVQERVQTGAVDPAQLCHEAQAILGGMPQQ